MQLEIVRHGTRQKPFGGFRAIGNRGLREAFNPLIVGR